MDEFARRADDDRLAFINEAAARRDVTPIIIEKDFWVCWTLRRLMEVPVLRDHLTFKGGTSLSKAYGIIERFSEDIDLTIGRDAPLVSETLPPMEDGISGKERERRTKALKAAAQSYVQTIALPELAKAIEASLGTTEDWTVRIDPDDRDAQTILFEYPKLLEYSIGGWGRSYGQSYGTVTDGYIKPRIKLEFGARGETEPSESRTITPYLAAEFPGELPNAEVQVSTLSVLRSFWEKVTILHALHHGTKLLPEMSRHYYDTMMLAAKGIDDEAKERPDLLAKVVLNKSLMFADNKASYGTAMIGSLRLVPTDELRARLAGDYAAMSEMFMAPPPSFDDLMVAIAALETKLNG
ncbi:nucleotidyl transferase AbiEii/AbiGii toxin family protein [Sphingomonas canadensis]|uniref:Nucleotidyl transferase AbiEii/AbiGii toxin family protein n=1 Tax=Sphingomonas canadensis TaxID=1219257 RepID=A0ABW3H867_9SPHN|nr:nucleotidyl transferase AbiEii/AbiGii toxin family protein [Sphingomonas canadensis]MCW3837444.1 nucleotidyl transferase AbiEii/AbiGii toxin family protein [Sphingomonas canadensis]